MFRRKSGASLPSSGKSIDELKEILEQDSPELATVMAALTPAIIEFDKFKTEVEAIRGAKQESTGDGDFLFLATREPDIFQPSADDHLMALNNNKAPTVTTETHHENGILVSSNRKVSDDPTIRLEIKVQRGTNIMTISSSELRDRYAVSELLANADIVNSASRDSVLATALFKIMYQAVKAQHHVALAFAGVDSSKTVAVITSETDLHSDKLLRLLDSQAQVMAQYLIKQAPELSTEEVAGMLAKLGRKPQ